MIFALGVSSICVVITRVISYRSNWTNWVSLFTFCQIDCVILVAGHNTTVPPAELFPHNNSTRKTCYSDRKHSFLSLSLFMTVYYLRYTTAISTCYFFSLHNGDEQKKGFSRLPAFTHLIPMKSYLFLPLKKRTHDDALFVVVVVGNESIKCAGRRSIQRAPYI